MDNLAYISDHKITFAVMFLAIQFSGMLWLIIYLRRFGRSHPPYVPGGPNPFKEPIIIPIIFMVAVGIIGLLLTVGRGWGLLIESPLLLMGTIARVKARTESPDQMQ